MSRMRIPCAFLEGLIARHRRSLWRAGIPRTGGKLVGYENFGDAPKVLEAARGGRDEVGDGEASANA